MRVPRHGCGSVAPEPQRHGLIDRQRERETLRSLLDGPGASLAVVTGRRRIGKTYLLTRTWPDDVTFLVTATRTTPEQNRRQLIVDLAS